MRDHECYMQLHQFFLSPDILTDITKQLDFLSVEHQVRLYNFLVEYFGMEVDE